MRARSSSSEGEISKQTTADRGRFSSKRKSEAVLRLLRGEDLDSLSRELGVTAAKLSEWRDALLADAEAGLKSRDTSSDDDETVRLKAKVGELTMENELLRIKVGIDPLPWRKLRG